MHGGIGCGGFPGKGNRYRLGSIIAVCLAIALSVSLLFSLTSIQAYLSDLFDDKLGISFAEGYTIDAAEVLVAAPITDMAPDPSASAAGKGYAVGPVVWDPAHDPFQIGIEYTASVTLTAKNGCLFAETLEIAAINGYDAVVSGNTGTQVTLAYTFGATSAAVTAFAAQTAFCTAANNQTPGRVYHVAAPADTDTTFTLSTATTTKTKSGAYVTNVDNIPGVFFEYSGADGLLASVCSEDKAVINIPAGFSGDVDVTIHAEKYQFWNVRFTLVIRSVEDTIANAAIPSATPWDAGIHNAVFVAGDWEWRVLDKGIGAGSNNEALVMSMHTHSAFMSPFSPSKNASGYQTSLARSHAIGQYGSNTVFRWAHGYSVEPGKTLWTQTSPGSTIIETVSSGTLTKDAGSGYDGCFLLSRNDMSLAARGFTSAGYGSSGNQNTVQEPSRQFTTTDGNPLGDFGGAADNSHFWVRSFWNGNSAQELNSNGGWGTGQSDASRNRYYLPAMIIRYNTRIGYAAMAIAEPAAAWAPYTSSPAGAPGYAFTEYSIEENYGPVTGGNTVTVTGIDFSAGATTVAIGGRPCTITSVAPTGYSLTCTVPAGDFGPADVMIADGKGVVAVIRDGYTWHPVLAGVSPDSGPTAGGTGFGAGYDPNGRIAVSGAGFIMPARIAGMEGASPACSVETVTIGGYDCEWELVSDNEIVCRPPASALPGDGEGTVDVVVGTILGSNAIVPDGAAGKYTYAYGTDGPNGCYGDDDNVHQAEADGGAAAGEAAGAPSADEADGGASADEAGDNAFAGNAGDGYACIDEPPAPTSIKAPVPDGEEGDFPIDLRIVLLPIVMLALAIRVWLSVVRRRRSRP